MSQNKNINQTIAMANTVGQIGCVTAFVAIIIVGIAFGVGQLLDGWLDLKGVFTVILMLGSFPVTLFAITRISLGMVGRAQKQAAAMTKSHETQNEEENSV